MVEKRRIYVPPITGEYAPEDQILARARQYFLMMIQAYTPKPLYFLRDEVLPKYRDAFARHKEAGRSDYEVKVRSCQALVDVIIGDESERVRSSREFQDARSASLGLFDASSALLDWSGTFNLKGKRAKIDRNIDSNALNRARTDAMWPLLAALETILHWHLDPAGLLWARGNPPGWRPPVQLFKQSPAPPETLPPIQLKMTVPWQPTTEEEQSAVSALEETMRQRVIKTFEHDDAALRDNQIKEIMEDVKSEMERYPKTLEIDVPDWLVGMETKGEFESRMRASFERWLDRHITERNESALSKGLIEVPGPCDPTHFIWAAKYQVESATTKDIAAEWKRKGIDATASNVGKAIRGVLNAIRLERREGRRGPKAKKG